MTSSIVFKDYYEKSSLERFSDRIVEPLRGRILGREYVRVEKVSGEFVLQHISQPSEYKKWEDRVLAIKNPVLGCLAMITLFVLSFLALPLLPVYIAILKGAEGLKWIALKLDKKAANYDAICKEAMKFKKEFDLACEDIALIDETKEKNTTTKEHRQRFERLVQSEQKLQVLAEGLGISNPYPIEELTRWEVETIVADYFTFDPEHGFPLMDLPSFEEEKTSLIEETEL